MTVNRRLEEILVNQYNHTINKNFMSKQLLSNIIIVLLIIGGISAYGYYRSETVESCDKTLSRYGANHACISTSRGLMVAELYPAEAPKSVERFTKLANENKFYDGLEFYRVSKGFVAQAGLQDFQVRNNGVNNFEESIQNKIKLTEEKIETEANFDKLNLNTEERETLSNEGFTSNTTLNSRLFEYGSLSFANAGPGTNSTEFFIVSNKDKESSNLRYLRGRFTNMGKVVEGLDVLEKINESTIDRRNTYSSEKPQEEIKIFEIRVK